jgi:hypothetical protein
MGGALMNKERLQSVLGLLMIGDSVVNLVPDRQYLELWKSRGAPDSAYNRAMQYFIERPMLLRTMAAAGLVLGITLVRRAGKAAVETPQA